MSVELRITTTGHCECGIPHPGDYQPGCDHGIECDWGKFGDPPLVVRDYLAKTTTVEGVSPLILVSKSFADRGAMPSDCGGWDISRFYTESGRRFMRIEADNGSWTWELLDAHWDDGVDCDVYVGRWPD
ncbi:hypothetical protein [Mycolicibacterium mageritense]|uniref:hypothetical protein n=1 Tax=Mycolicibacterium mageritense TaxID=53462 RepID=UPI001E332C1A|nr:hypothetical protein [Mycolicibacterium mageritense]MCC9182584.1 hypothetical protein [Mycolicibacterium mageritense]